MTPEEYYRKYLEGDDEAIGGVIDGLYSDLMRFVEGILGNYHDAEDVVQEVFIRISLKKSIYRGNGTFGAWVYKIARNCAINAWKGRMSILQRLEMDEEKLNSIAGPMEEDPQEQCLLMEEQENFIRSLGRLNEEHRQILYLMYIKDFSPAEIAKVMGMRPRRAYKIIEKARESYRRMMEEGGDEYEEH
ncbi:MAG: RNA polymerase sigma factor [Lachnospiraceae bacterium]|nr:RNA polymerase sigma factor [Lachnospiraceae bacterium]